MKTAMSIPQSSGIANLRNLSIAGLTLFTLPASLCAATLTWNGGGTASWGSNAS